MTMVATGLIIGVVVAALVVLFVLKNGRRRRLRVNGVLVMEVDRGARLMTVLAAQGVQLPGTCGGKGTCAGCKCQVFSGGGPISPQEAPYFSQQAIRDHWRLACQVVVKGDMSIRVPDDLLPPGTIQLPWE
jgi:Na+-transporting NADH:ubiquinone oxidoreductase subunit F